MKEIISYILKSINIYRTGANQATPSEIRSWEVFVLDLKAALFALVIGAGLFFTVAGSNSSEKWSQEREDEEWEEFKLLPLNKVESPSSKHSVKNDTIVSDLIEK